jgi:hypothetical protein
MAWIKFENIFEVPSSINFRENEENELNKIIKFGLNFYFDHRENDTIRNSIAGAAAGAGASFLTCPLDVVKTQLQNSTVPRYSGTLNGLLTIWREEGYRGWYRGLSATMLGYLPSWAIYFSVYEETKRLLYRTSASHPQFVWNLPSMFVSEKRQNGAQANGHLRTSSLEFGQHSHVVLSPGVINIISAMCAGFVSTTVTNPLWVVKTRFMVLSNVSFIPSLSSCCLEITSKSDLPGRKCSNTLQKSRKKMLIVQFNRRKHSIMNITIPQFLMPFEKYIDRKGWQDFTGV